jgi:hypothetical protein
MGAALTAIRHHSLAWPTGTARVGSSRHNYWGYFVNVAPSFGILAVLYFVVTAVLTSLAIYILILGITFLRLRIAEMKRGAPPKGDSRLP